MAEDTVNTEKKTLAGAYNDYWRSRSRYRPLGNYTPVPPEFNLADGDFQFSPSFGEWPWANDPCAAVYNEADGLYYSWMLYRDKTADGFPTDWIEMVSEDCINWRQTEKRLARGVHAKSPWAGEDRNVSFMGGSVWVDKENRFGYGANAAIFMVSMNHCVINGVRGYDQSVGCFIAPDGLGAPIDEEQSFLLFTENPTGTDWRDTRMQWDEENKQLLFVISNHGNVQFYANKTGNLRKFSRLQIFDTSYPSGIECPEFHPILDAVTKRKYWLLVVAKQNPQGGLAAPQQTVLWFLGRWNGRKFTPENSGVLEYGHDFYAQSVSAPRQEDNPEFLLLRGYLGNWGYNQEPYNWPQIGFMGGCWEDRRLYVENGAVKARPHIDLCGEELNLCRPVDGALPIWIKAKIKPASSDSRAGDSGVYELQWRGGDKVVITADSTIRFDIGKSGALILPGKVFAPMPAPAQEEELDIFINGCCLSFYIGGLQASFQIFPRGDFAGLSHIHGDERITEVKYYDISRVFA